MKTNIHLLLVFISIILITCKGAENEHQVNIRQQIRNHTEVRMSPKGADSVSYFVRWISLNEKERAIVKTFWASFRENLRKKDIEATINLSSFPLETNGALEFGIKNEGEYCSMEDFRNGFHQIFTQEVSQQFLSRNLCMIYEKYGKNRKLTCLTVGITLNLNIGINEKPMLFYFRRVNYTFELYRIHIPRPSRCGYNS